MNKLLVGGMWFVGGLLAGVLAMSQLFAQPSKPEWQVNIDWSFQNKDAGGSVDCPAEYVRLGVPQCIAIGGRACVMNYAKELALRGKDGEGRAYELTRLSQCHNPHAAGTIERAGVGAVVPYVANHQTY